MANCWAVPDFLIIFAASNCFLILLNMTANDFRLRLKSLIDKSSISKEAIISKLPSINSILDGGKVASLDDILVISELLNVSPYWLFLNQNNLFEEYDITLEELEDMNNTNGSLRGVIVGYMAEKKLKQLLESDSRFIVKGKPDDHDRKIKCDLIVEYRGRDFRFESKSLQSTLIKPSLNKKYELEAKVQCDASDCRDILLPNGEIVNTTCLQYGDFDILAVNMYMFHQRWEFAFALNEDLPQSTFKGGRKKKDGTTTPIISDEALKYLMKSLITITYPVSTPFVTDPCVLLDRLIERRG